MATAADNKREIEGLKRAQRIADIKMLAIKKSQQIIIASLEKAGIELVTLEELEEMQKVEEVVQDPPASQDAPPAGKYDDVDVEELREEATKRELNFHPATGKVKLIALLEKDDMTPKTTDDNKENDDGKDSGAF